VDSESDLAIATLAQILLQEGRTTEALEFFDKAVELGRTEGELVSALSYAEVYLPLSIVNDRRPGLNSMLLRNTLTSLKNSQE